MTGAGLPAALLIILARYPGRWDETLADLVPHGLIVNWFHAHRIARLLDGSDRADLR